MRLLHISDPANLVMGIVGKKYPENKELFRKSRLDGVFDQMMAGKRMKLKTPVTWETQISLKGNKASVWEMLIDEKKLPYMATVRNIRNLLLAGISQQHVYKVCKYISNEVAVTRGKMFPYQYFTAYDVLNEIKDIKEGNNDKKKKFEKKKDNEKEKEKWMLAKEKKRDELISNVNLNHLESIKSALDKAVNFSAKRNIPPLKGTTLILCGYSLNMMDRFTAAKGVTQRGASKRDACALFSLMCQQASEDGHLVLFSSKFMSVDLKDADLLSNVEFIKTDYTINKKIGLQNGNSGSKDTIEKYLSEEIWVDNIVIFTDDQPSDIYNSVQRYRKYVNKDVLFANVNIIGTPSEALETEILMTHQNDLNIFGFSESVFNLIINKGNGGQLTHAENIDKKYNLKKLPNPLNELKVSASSNFDSFPVWQDVKIFISSTFLDMESERNLLHQFVLPQLQRKAAKRFVNIDFIDLRWGLTEEQINTKGQVQLCLEQIKRCDLFIGILGERYGSIPSKDLLKELPPEYEDFVTAVENDELSMTQLEMEYGVLQNAEASRNRAFFFFRDDDFTKDLTEEEYMKYTSKDRLKLLMLKNKIRNSNLEVMEDYPACFYNNRVAGLEEFGIRSLNVLWNAVENLFPAKMESYKSKFQKEYQVQIANCNRVNKEFVSRSKILTNIRDEMKKSNLIQLAGQEGTGRSSILRKIASDMARSKSTLVIPYVQDDSDFTEMEDALQYFIINLDGELPKDINAQSLAISFQEAVEKNALSDRKVFILLDIQTETENTSWIPDMLPENIVIMITTRLGGKVNCLLKKRKDSTEMVIKPLELKERTEICREMLIRKGKTLDEDAFNNQLLTLVGKREAGSPSYLALAIDKIVKEANFENLKNEIGRLGITTLEILEQILIEAETLFGEEIVRIIFLFISQSTHGLSRTQIGRLVDIHYHLKESNITKLSNIGELMKELPKTKNKLPTSVSFMDICLCLEKLGSLLVYSKQIFKLTQVSSSIIFERYIKKSKATTMNEIHSLMAAFYIDAYKRGIFQPEIICSLPHHIGVCGDFKMLRNIICSPDFIQIKASVGLGHLLLSDYLGTSFKFKSAMEKFRSDQLVIEYREFILNNLNTVRHQPDLIPQAILNEPEDSILKMTTELIKSAPQLKMFKCLNGPRRKEERRFEGQSIWDYTNNPLTIMLPVLENTISGFTNGLILVTETYTQENLFCLLGHSQEITGMGLLTRNTLVSSSKDGLLCSWDLEKRIRLHSVKAHDRVLSSLSIRHPNIVTVGWDGVIKLWDKALVNVTTIVPNNGPLNCVLVHPRKELCITGGWDNALRIWDLKTYKQKGVIRGHQSSVQCILLSEDCRKIISGKLYVLFNTKLSIVIFKALWMELSRCGTVVLVQRWPLLKLAMDCLISRLTAAVRCYMWATAMGLLPHGL